VIGYTIDALVADAEMVAAAWTGTLPRRRRDRQRAEPVPHLWRPAPLDPHALIGPRPREDLVECQSRQGSRNPAS